MCDIHTKMRERTHRYLCDIHTKKVGQFHLEKEARRCGNPHKIRVMYEMKGNKEVYS